MLSGVYAGVISPQNILKHPETTNINIHKRCHDLDLSFPWQSQDLQPFSPWEKRVNTFQEGEDVVWSTKESLAQSIHTQPHEVLRASPVGSCLTMLQDRLKLRACNLSRLTPWWCLLRMEVC